MSKKTRPGIIATARQLLKDEFGDSDDYEWEDDELSVHIDECLVELSRVSPYMVKEVLTTIANSKVLDISEIEDLLWIDKLEYPTGNDPRDLRNFIELDADQIEIDTSLNPSAGGSGTLTGTVTFTNGSATVSGSGTDFDGELEAGYHIKKSTGTRWYRIYSIESDTSLTLAETCLEATGADTVNVTEYCYEAVYVYCAKVHDLTNTSSSLNPEQERLLVLGVCGKAAISKARSLIDKVNVGGAISPSQMQNWGETLLDLFREGLGEEKPKIYRRYPRD